jgi:hypothetical protein
MENSRYMIDNGEPDDSPEYLRAREEWSAFWNRINQHQKGGTVDNPVVAVHRLAQQFGISAVIEAVQQYFDNLPFNFEHHWRSRREARLRAEDVAQQQQHNPYGAGRKVQRSDVSLFGVWLIVNRTMRIDGLTTAAACRKLVKPPSRRGASRWRGLLLHKDRESAPYYVNTAETLRDLYYEAVSRYRGLPEGLKRQWDVTLATSLGVRGGG